MAEDEEAASPSEPSSPVKKESLLQRMLNSIVEERNRVHPTIGDDDSGFELVNVSDFWTKLFSQYFLDGSTSPDESRDDMLFYVRRNKLGAKGKPASLQAEIEVYRRDSKKLPSLDDKTVDWEETVYLNIILHQNVTAGPETGGDEDHEGTTVPSRSASRSTNDDRDVVRDDSGHRSRSRSSRDDRMSASSRDSTRHEGVHRHRGRRMYDSDDNYDGDRSTSTVRDRSPRPHGDVRRSRRESLGVQRRSEDSDRTTTSSHFHIDPALIAQIMAAVLASTASTKKDTTTSGVHGPSTSTARTVMSRQMFVYRVTCAVCTRTDEKNLQILRKFTQRVYPSPSRRRMDSKGTEEEITYPNIFFTVDNFEEAFQDIIIRDSENIAVELLATDKDGSFQGLIFQGSVKYESLKRVYDARISLTSKMVQRMSLGWFKGHKRVEYMRMRGPQGKGHAEMAVSRVKGSGPETPDMENFPVDDFDDQQNQYAQRRMSDPSSGFSSLMRGGFRRAVGMKKSQSETENVETIADDGCHEVEAGTLQEELNTNLDQYNGFWGKSFGQAWHWFKEQKRASSVALNAYLTYITLPWHRIIADMIDARHQPALTH